MTNDMQHPSVDSDDPAETETPARTRTRRSPAAATLANNATATEVDGAVPATGETDPAQDTAEPEVRRRTRPSATRRRSTSTPAATTDAASVDDPPSDEPAGSAPAEAPDDAPTAVTGEAIPPAPVEAAEATDQPPTSATEDPFTAEAADQPPAPTTAEPFTAEAADDLGADDLGADELDAAEPTAAEPTAAELADGGLAADGQPAPELAADGLAADGLAADGLAAGDLAADGLTAGDLADDGLTAGHLADDRLADGSSAKGELVDGGLADGGLGADELSAADDGALAQGESADVSAAAEKPATVAGDEVAVDDPGVAAVDVVLGAVEVRGALEEPELDVEAEPTGAAEPALLVRRRRRRRAEGGDVSAPEQTEPPLLDTAVDDETPAEGTAELAEDDRGEVLDRALDRAVEAVDARDGAESDEEPGDGDAEAEAGAEVATDGEAAQRSRRRRRGGRGRGRRGGSRSNAAGDDSVAEATDEADGLATANDERGAGPARRGKTRDGAVDDTDRDGADELTADVDADVDADIDGVETETEGESRGTPSTRLTARGRGRGRTRPGERPGAGVGSRGRRPAGTVSEETRRAIAEAPPKKMLVSVGEKRTQVVVLEERSLVEHYVTRREDVSYVGNIYVGRVQNVLPGMEAAFVDIGKGRNGVLYAGEVNYDEADLEGELPRIEQTLKPGQTVLVQVTKDPMGTKGARLTQQLSIAGRYCVLAPSDGMLGISRKLPEDERERLRKILKTIKPDDYGLIVRTAAEGATREQLEDDVARLVRIWEGVLARANDADPLSAVYEEPELVIRVIRDVFGPDYRELVVDDEVLGNQIRSYLADVSPELVDKVSVYSGEEALFNGYEVTNQIRRALEKKVWLASGGYLIVEKTEAMWVIDVNTGKFVGKSNLEETVLKNNLEAAAEIARQLRLRDMGGIIVIDFVDMLVPANRDEVLKRFKRELARDKTKSRVMEISKLGLVQMTRKNVSQGLNESFTTVCECCDGRGAQIVESMLG